MRILIVSFYYPPDVGPGALRASGIVEALLRRIGPSDHVHLLTAVPNRFSTLKIDAPLREVHDRLTIERIPISAHQNGFRDQALAYSRFAREVLRRIRLTKADVVLATSSRLMTAALGGLVARRLRARLYLDIRDLFTKNMTELVGATTRWPLLFLLSRIERWAFRQADRISIVSPGFLQHVRKLRPDITPSILTNGIDQEFLDANFDKADNRLPVILYAGNIGDGQGLEHVVPRAAELLAGHYRFRIIGDGGRRRVLEQGLSQMRPMNGAVPEVEILPAMPRGELLEHYARADILFLHLNDLDAFRLVIPSKLFEYGATGKPIIAGVAGVAGIFVREWLENAAVFEPRDADGMAKSLATLRRGQTDRARFKSTFKRSTIMDTLADELYQLGCKPAADSPGQAGPS